MKKKNFDPKIVLGFSLATVLALGGLVAADVVINPNTMIAKADEAEEVIFDFTGNNENQEAATNSSETPDTEINDIPEEDSNSESSSEPADDNPDDEIPPSDSNTEDESGEEPSEEHTHSICYTSLDDSVHVISCTEAGCEYTETASHLDESDGAVDEKCICGFVISSVPAPVPTPDPSEEPETEEETINPTDGSDEGDDVVDGDDESDQEEEKDTEPGSAVSQEEYDKMKEKVSQLEQKVKDLKKELSEANEASASLANQASQQVSDLNSRISSLESRNSQLQNLNTSLSNKNTTLSADISSLKNQVSSLKGELNSLSKSSGSGNIQAENVEVFSKEDEDTKKAQVADIQNLIDSDTYPAEDTNFVSEAETYDTFDGINTSNSSTEVTFDFTTPAVDEAAAVEEMNDEGLTQTTQTEVNVEAEKAYATFDGVPVNSLRNTKNTTKSAMAAAGIVGTISLISMIGLCLYGKKTGILGKKEITLDNLDNDEEAEETDTLCMA